VSNSRIEAFSDGVFAIAATLLVLDLHVPDVQHGLGHALTRQWPSYTSFLVSFAVLGIIWVNHHAALEHVAGVGRPLLFLNLLLLLSVVIIPFPTAVMAKYLRGTQEDQHVAAAFYSGAMIFMGSAFGTLWMYILNGHLRPGTIAPAELPRLRLRFIVGTPAYGLTLLVAFISAPICLAMHAVLAVYYAVPGKGGALPHPRPAPVGSVTADAMEHAGV
jgi:uncharacterized membrane protein